MARPPPPPAPPVCPSARVWQVVPITDKPAGGKAGEKFRLEETIAERMKQLKRETDTSMNDFQLRNIASEIEGVWAPWSHPRRCIEPAVHRRRRGGKRPRQQPAHPQYANYWAPLTRKRHTMPHSAQSQHANHWAARTRKRHQQEHRPQRPTERSDPTQHAEGRTGDCPGPCKGATTRRNVTQGVAPPPPPPRLPMFEADSQNFASAPSVPRGFELKNSGPGFGGDRRGTLGGGGSRPLFGSGQAFLSHL